MIIDLIGGTYEQRFKDWSAQRTINWYPKIADQKEKDKTQIALVPRPGLTQFANVSGNSVRGLFTARTLTQERLFAVVDTNLWEILYDGSTVLRGALTGMSTGSKSKVYMALNGNSQLMVQDPLAAYVFDLTDNTLAKNTDIDYPGGTTLDYADGYFVISDLEGRVTFSELNDGLDWPGSNFFTPTFKPDKVKAVVTSREEVICFGDETIEVYINDGDTPFIRQSRTSMYYGLTARDSIAVHQSGVFFLGKSKTGGSEVYLLGNDYSLNPVSTPAISQMLNRSSNEDAEGFVMCSTDGHIFYHLHIPALNTTLVFDIVTGMWHERQSVRPFANANGEKIQDVFRGRNFVAFKGMNLYGDWWSGKIFKEDLSVTTDDGNIRVLERISSVFHSELKYVSVYSLEFDLNSGFGRTTGQGSKPIMMLKYSIDGGNTFEPEEFVELGNLGMYDQRVQSNNLGTARDWVISFKVTDPIDVMVMQAVARGSVGRW
jgi:hypothetical protein